VRKEYQNYDLDHNKKSEIEADLNSMDSQILSPKPKVSNLTPSGWQCATIG